MAQRKTSVNMAIGPRLSRFSSIWQCVGLWQVKAACPVYTSQSDFVLAKHFKENSLMVNYPYFNLHKRSFKTLENWDPSKHEKFSVFQSRSGDSERNVKKTDCNSRWLADEMLVISVLSLIRKIQVLNKYPVCLRFPDYLY